MTPPTIQNQTNKNIRQDKRACSAPPFLPQPSFTPFRMSDYDEWRSRAREESPHLLPPFPLPPSRKNRFMRASFWPGVSLFSRPDSWGSAPEKSGRKSSNARENNAAAVLKGPTTRLASDHSWPSKPHSILSLFKRLSIRLSNSSRLDCSSLPAGFSIVRKPSAADEDPYGLTFRQVSPPAGTATRKWSSYESFSSILTYRTEPAEDCSKGKSHSGRPSSEVLPPPNNQSPREDNNAASPTQPTAGSRLDGEPRPASTASSLPFEAMLSRFSVSDDGLRDCGREKKKKNMTARAGRKQRRARDLIDVGIGHEDSYGESSSSSKKKMKNDKQKDKQTQTRGNNSDAPPPSFSANHDSSGSNTSNIASPSTKHDNNNTSPTPSKTKQKRNVLRKKPASSYARFRLSWLTAKLNLFDRVRKRKIRHGKRPAVISRPMSVSIAEPNYGDGDGHVAGPRCPLPADFMCQRGAVGKVYPTPTPTLPVTECDSEHADATQSCLPGLGRTLSEKVMRLGHAGERELVISEVVAVDRWGLPMRRYPIEDGVKMLTGSVEHSERFPQWPKKRVEAKEKERGLRPVGGEESGKGKDEEGEEERRNGVEPCTEEDAADQSDVRVGDKLVASKSADLLKLSSSSSVSRSWDRDGKRTAIWGGLDWDDIEKKEKAEEAGLSKTKPIRSDLAMRPLSRSPIGVSKKAGNDERLGKLNFSQPESESERILMTTPEAKRGNGRLNAMQGSPNDSGYGGSPTSTSKAVSRHSTTGSGREQRQDPPGRDSGYSGGSESKSSPCSSSLFSARPETDREYHVKRKSLMAEMSFEERRESLRRAARKENEMMERREHHCKDLEDKVFAEQLQLQQLKQKNLSWWEKSQPRVRVRKTVRSRVQKPPRKMQTSSTTAISGWQNERDSDSLTLSSTEYRLSLLKAAKKDAFDYAKVYHDCVEETVNWLHRPPSTVSAAAIKKQRRRRVMWSASESSEDSRTNHLESSKSVSWDTAPESAGGGLGSSGEEVSSWSTVSPSVSTGPLGSDDNNNMPPPLPKRSSRRIRFSQSGLPRRSPAPASESKRSGELVEGGGSETGTLPVIAESGVQVPPDEEKDKLEPEPLNPHSARRQRLERTQRIKQVLRTTVSEFGGNGL